MAIDVFFTGLMLICLKGDANANSCLSAGAKNTAWVVNADGGSMPCGRDSPETTQLELTFSTNDFEYKPGYLSYSVQEDGAFRCILPAKKICVDVKEDASAQEKAIKEGGLKNLLRLYTVDDRFRTLNTDRLKDSRYVSTSITFPYGKVGSGELWPKEASPTQWFRSDGRPASNLPGKLSDRLRVEYQTNVLDVTDCSGNSLISLKLKGDSTAEVVFRNGAMAPPVADQIGQYDDLGYLLWYNRLAEWKTTFNACPDYTPTKKDAVLLRCVRERRDGCAYDPTAKSDTRFWPVVRP